MLDRVPQLFGSVLLLLGAFAIGSVLHQSFVKGAFGATSPPAVFGIIGGIVLIVVGHRLERRFDPSAYVIGGEEDGDGDGDGDEAGSAEEAGDAGDGAATLDGDRGPVPSERLDGLEKDESYDGK